MRGIIGRLVVGAAAAWLLGGDATLAQAAENRPPVALVTVDSNIGEAPLTVCFDATGSKDPEGLPLAYEWDFGDGSRRSHLPKACHVYVEAGLYAAMLEVADAGDLIDRDVAIIRVLAPSTVLPPVSAR